MIQKLIQRNRTELTPKIDKSVEKVSVDLLAKNPIPKGKPRIKPHIQIKNKPISFLVYLVGLVPKCTS